MRHLIALFIGLLVGGLGLLAVAGPDGLFVLLMIIVLCTGGLGLIPLLFACWLLGLAVLTVAEAVGRGGKPESTYVGPRGRQGPLADYIRKARAEGTSEARLEEVLADAGWRRDEIAEARRRIAESPAG